VADGSIRTIALVAALLTTPILSGCLAHEEDGGGEDDPGWWTVPANATPEPVDARELEPEAPPAPWVDRFVEATADEVRSTAAQEVENASSDVEPGRFNQGLRSAERHEELGATTWALDDLLHAVEDIELQRVFHEAMGEDVPRGYPMSEDAARGYLEDRTPAADARDAQAAVEEAWTRANASGLPGLHGLLRSHSPAHDLVVVFEQLRSHEEDPRFLAADAPFLVGYERIATPVAANATALPGEPLAEEPADLSPLLEAAERLAAADPFPGENRSTHRSLSEARSTHQSLSDTVHWAEIAQEHGAQNRTGAAAGAALVALAHGEMLHRLHEDRLPDEVQVEAALANVSQPPSNATVFVSHTAWHGMAQADLEDDVRWHALAVGVDEVWPLAEAVDRALTQGEPVDWAGTLEPLLERWKDSWLDAEDA
jgi:hypothetical protein